MVLLVVLVGGFVWDYGPDADPYDVREPGATWVRTVWFAHARFAAPSDSHSLSGAFDPSVWLPRTLTSAALIVLVWWAVYLTGNWEEVLLPSPAAVWDSLTSHLTGANGLLAGA